MPAPIENRAVPAAVRKIIHCDCDCFYASIEMRDNPELQSVPLAVGGSSERRGVVATCNYEARKFGIHSAMASATAKRLCPQLVIVRPNMEKYREASAAIHEIFRSYTPLIEPLSLDEAFLDVSEASACQGSATLIAQQIRGRVRESLGITLSAGIAPNKFLAKIASDWNKPDGQFVITPRQVDAFVQQLPVKKLHGVGKVTAARLHALNIQSCADMRQYSEEFLLMHFGSFGSRLYQLCRGVDEREVKAERIRKSLSVENTYTEDLPDVDSCLAQLPALHEQMVERLRRLEGRYQVSKKFVKLKFHDFVSTTVEQLADNSDLSTYPELLRQAWLRGKRPVRLLGVGVRLRPLSEQTGQIAEPAAVQLPLSFAQSPAG